MSLGNREGKVCEETEPEDLPELVQLKCTASDRRLQGDRCVLLSVCRRTFFLAENKASVTLAFNRSRTRNSDSSAAMVKK